MQGEIVGERQLGPPREQHGDQFLLVTLVQLHRDAGLELGEAGEQRRHEPSGQREEAAERDLAPEPVAVVERVLRELRGMLEQQPRLVDDLLPGQRQRNAASVPADEQRHADEAFDLRDRARDGRLGDVEATGGFRDVAGIGGGNDVAKLAQGELHGVSASGNPIESNGISYFVDLAALRHP